MILIDGHWERVNTLQDISRIIREYYNSELADEMDGLIDEFEGNEILREETKRLRELEDIIDEIRMLVG